MSDFGNDAPLNLDEEALTDSGFFNFGEKESQVESEIDVIDISITEHCRSHQEVEQLDASFAEISAEVEHLN